MRNLFFVNDLNDLFNAFTEILNSIELEYMIVLLMIHMEKTAFIYLHGGGDFNKTKITRNFGAIRARFRIAPAVHVFKSPGSLPLQTYRKKYPSSDELQLFGLFVMTWCGPFDVV